MSTSSASDWAFLQQLYAQDTLYMVPDEYISEAEPVPAQAAVVPRPAAPVEVNTPAAERPKVEAPKVEEPVRTSTPKLPSFPAPSAPAQNEPIQWLGEAVKGTYLLFSVEQENFLSMPKHLFLQKVMAAVGLTTMQVKFGNLSPSVTQNIKELAAAQQAKHILLFGDSLPVENLLKLEPYRMYKSGETRFVRVDTLADIEKSVELKKKLWDVLQKIFLQ